jgi:hypothetical protein
VHSETIVHAVAARNRPVAAWLFVCCAMVFALVVVGGITRLTHSGLSIVEWQPFVGTFPPLTAEQWDATFAKYQQTPEFRLVNHDMSLDGFKTIFWWEYIHRLLGRLVGVVFLLPLIYLAMARKVGRDLMPRLAFIFLLGGLQGARHTSGSPSSFMAPCCGLRSIFGGAEWKQARERPGCVISQGDCWRWFFSRFCRADLSPVFTPAWHTTHFH